jgi:hypothetical protein
MTTYPQSRPRPAQKEAAGPVIQETSRARHANINSTRPTAQRRTRPTLSEVVDVLSTPASIPVTVFRTIIGAYGQKAFAVFPDAPEMAYPLSEDYEAGSPRLRLAIERAGYGTVSHSMLASALLAAELPLIDWGGSDLDWPSKPFLLPAGMLRAINLIQRGHHAA